LERCLCCTLDYSAFLLFCPYFRPTDGTVFYCIINESVLLNQYSSSIKLNFVLFSGSNSAFAPTPQARVVSLQLSSGLYSFFKLATKLQTTISSCSRSIPEYFQEPVQGPILLSKDSAGFSNTTTDSATLMPISSSVQADHSSISTDPTSEKGVETRSGRTSDLLDRSSEPSSGAYSPEPQGVGKDDPDCDGRVVERL